MRKVQTEEFWECMSRAAFFRIDYYSGSLYGEVVYCDRPPESVDGLIENKICMTLALIKPRQSMLDKILSFFGKG